MKLFVKKHFLPLTISCFVFSTLGCVGSIEFGNAEDNSVPAILGDKDPKKPDEKIPEEKDPSDIDPDAVCEEESCTGSAGLNRLTKIQYSYTVQQLFGKSIKVDHDKLPTDSSVGPFHSNPNGVTDPDIDKYKMADYGRVSCVHQAYRRTH